MKRSPLDEYLEGRGPKAVQLVVALDDAVRAAHPDLNVAVKYRMLMYALDGDWRHWVCAIGETNKGVCLRFLYGVLLDDPSGILRSGSSVLKTWDFGFDDAVDRAAVGAFVREAVARNGEYKATAPEVLEASRAAARSRERQKA